MGRGLIERLCIRYINSRRNDIKFISRLTNRVQTIVNDKYENETMLFALDILKVVILAITLVFIVCYYYIWKNHINWWRIAVFIMVCLYTLIPMRIRYLLTNLNYYLQTINKK